MNFQWSWTARYGQKTLKDDVCVVRSAFKRFELKSFRYRSSAALHVSKLFLCFLKLWYGRKSAQPCQWRRPFLLTQCNLLFLDSKHATFTSVWYMCSGNSSWLHSKSGMILFLMMRKRRWPLQLERSAGVGAEQLESFENCWIKHGLVAT